MPTCAKPDCDVCPAGEMGSVALHRTSDPPWSRCAYYPPPGIHPCGGPSNYTIEISYCSLGSDTHHHPGKPCTDGGETETELSEVCDVHAIEVRKWPGLKRITTKESQ